MKGGSVVYPTEEQVKRWSGYQWVHKGHFYEGDGDWLLSILAEDLTGKNGPRDRVQVNIKKNVFNFSFIKHRNGRESVWRVSPWSCLEENKLLSSWHLKRHLLKRTCLWSLITCSRVEQKNWNLKAKQNAMGIILESLPSHRVVRA